MKNMDVVKINLSVQASICFGFDYRSKTLLILYWFYDGSEDLLKAI